MYTVYDFINTKIDPKHMKFGWKVEIVSSQGLSCNSQILLRYTCLNFNWRSIDYLNDEIYNMFLSSESYCKMKEKIDKAREKYGQLYFSSFSIENLKYLVKNTKLKINLDKLIETAIRKRSEKIKEKISEQKSLQEN